MNSFVAETYSHTGLQRCEIWTRDAINNHFRISLAFKEALVLTRTNCNGIWNGTWEKFSLGIHYHLNRNGKDLALSLTCYKREILSNLSSISTV